MIKLEIYTDLISASLSFVRSISDGHSAYPLCLYFGKIPNKVSRPAAGGAGALDPGILISASTCDEDFDDYALKIAFNAELKELAFIVESVEGDEESLSCPLRALDNPESLLAIRKFLNEKLYSKLTASGASLDALIIHHLELLLYYLKPGQTPLISILETRELLKNPRIVDHVEAIASEISRISYDYFQDIENSLAMLNLFSLLTPEYTNLVLCHENPACLANALINVHFYATGLTLPIPDLIGRIIKQKYPDDVLELLKLLHEKKILTEKIIETIFKEADFPANYIRDLIQTLIFKGAERKQLGLKDIMYDFSWRAIASNPDEERSDLALDILYAIPALYASNSLSLENVIQLLESPNINKKAEELAATRRTTAAAGRLTSVFFEAASAAGAGGAAVSSGGAATRGGLSSPAAGALVTGGGSSSPPTAPVTGGGSSSPAAEASVPMEKDNLNTFVADLLRNLDSLSPYAANMLAQLFCIEATSNHKRKELMGRLQPRLLYTITTASNAADLAAAKENLLTLINTYRRALLENDSNRYLRNLQNFLTHWCLPIDRDLVIDDINRVANTTLTRILLA